LAPEEKQNCEAIKAGIESSISVMPDLIRHPVSIWIPAFAGMTTLGHLCRSNNRQQG
jgi:hypothetical protein